MMVDQTATVTIYQCIGVLLTGISGAVDGAVRNVTAIKRDLTDYLVYAVSTMTNMRNCSLNKTVRVLFVEKNKTVYCL